MLRAFNELRLPFLQKNKSLKEEGLCQDSQPSLKQFHSIKVVIMPWYDENQYQQQLSNELTKLGHQVTGVSCSTSAVIKTVKSDNADVLHLHWLHHFFLEEESSIKATLKMCLFILQLLLLRVYGVTIVWTIHNLKNHKNKHLLLDKIGSNIVARIAHKLIVHSETAKTEVAKNFSITNHDRIHVLPHPNYIGSYPNTITRQEARKMLNLPESGTVFLFFGMIQPYKGLVDLLNVFEKIKLSNTHLVIAGRPLNEQIGEQVQATAEKNQHIHYLPGFVPDDQLQIYMNASNVVAFPYREFLTSGAVILAMSFSRACIAPRRGHIGEILNDAGAFLYDPQVPDGLAQSLISSKQRYEELDYMGQYNYQVASTWSWKTITEKTVSLYRRDP